MPKYIDGFVIPVPKENLDGYRAMAARAAVVWKKHGALGYKECVSEDTTAEGMLSFPAGIGAKEGEVVMLSWILYESKESRDRTNAAVMQDSEISAMCESGEMPFDPQRMIYGGFEVIIDD